jgi:hypothetical protein
VILVCLPPVQLYGKFLSCLFCRRHCRRFKRGFVQRIPPVRLTNKNIISFNAMKPARALAQLLIRHVPAGAREVSFFAR